jgi:hypothetical protein
LDEVEYQLDWSDPMLGEVGEWTVIDARGYEIVVEGGSVMPYAVSLVSCADAGLDGDEASLWSWVAVEGVAWAGHGDAWDPSVAFGEHAEDLVSSAASELGPRVLDSIEYCQVHYLIGPGVLDFETGAQASIVVEGRYRAPGEQEWHAFEARTDEATGALFDFEATGATRIRVEIERDRARMFDDVAVDELDPDALGLALMRNLARGARVDVVAGD